MTFFSKLVTESPHPAPGAPTQLPRPSSSWLSSCDLTLNSARLGIWVAAVYSLQPGRLGSVIKEGMVFRGDSRLKLVREREALSGEGSQTVIHRSRGGIGIANACIFCESLRDKGGVHSAYDHFSNPEFPIVFL